MAGSLIVLFFIFLLIAVFTYTNGLHDVSNIIATMISSGAMSARRALLIAVVFELIGPLAGGTVVASTIASLVRVDKITAAFGNERMLIVVGAAIAAAITWNLITWHRGMPSSSSHALVGGLVGAALCATGSFGSVRWGIADLHSFELRGFAGIIAALLLSPFLGFAGGYVMCRVVRYLLRWASPRANLFLKRSQVLTAAAFAFTHGANTAQKSMGIMVMVMVATGRLGEFGVPFWIKLICAVALSLGALSGGWRIMKTVGRGIFHLRPEHGFEAQFTSATIILGNSLVGGPVSTTHITSSSIMGIGTAFRKKAVRWKKVEEILLSWIVTLPASFILGAFFCSIPIILSKI